MLSIITFNPAAILFYLQDSIKASTQSSLWFSDCGNVIVDDRTSDDKNSKLSSRVRSMAHPIDRASRILFPLAFYLFVMVYCLIFAILKTKTEMNEQGQV